MPMHPCFPSALISWWRELFHSCLFPLCWQQVPFSVADTTSLGSFCVFLRDGSLCSCDAWKTRGWKTLEKTGLPCCQDSFPFSGISRCLPVFTLQIINLLNLHVLFYLRCGGQNHRILAESIMIPSCKCSFKRREVIFKHWKERCNLGEHIFETS